MDEYKKTLDSFSTIFDKEKHNKLIERGERKLSHKALWGALMIWLNRDEPRFHLPFQLLSLLTDLDNLINRWRCKLQWLNNSKLTNIFYLGSFFTIRQSCLVGSKAGRQQKRHRWLQWLQLLAFNGRRSLQAIQRYSQSIHMAHTPRIRASANWRYS